MRIAIQVYIFWFNFTIFYVNYANLKAGACNTMAASSGLYILFQHDTVLAIAVCRIQRVVHTDAKVVRIFTGNIFRNTQAHGLPAGALKFDGRKAVPQFFRNHGCVFCMHAG